ncbi:30S ribosomal protein S8 [Hyphococcus flavus]|uniref:Small ribosomal subunit protein uS8 n=1 Tax=Hyphococcus flavus TaxID=1866326 RepID=A0AAF0CBH9_9PROT|nr:30S ribosomal protein S8 [Hyphococcus flavus]WDI31000.1 30S ribosomal protein S8 [Hyphococcus flavus]
MAINDPVGDLITRIRNAQMRRHSTMNVPASKLRGWVLDVLQSEGYIRGYSRTEKEGEKPSFDVELKYYEGAPVIQKIKRVSKPGRRVYSSVRDLSTVRNGLGISIVSTPKGVMSDAAARDANVGGEVLCEVY